MATGSDGLDFNGTDQYQATGFDKAIPTAKKQQQSTPVNTESNTEHDMTPHSTTVHPHNIPLVTSSNEHQLCVVPTLQMFQNQSELTVPMLEHHSIHSEGIQDCEPDLSTQELVVSESGPLILSIKEAIQEKIDEIQELKIKIDELNDLLHQAESREKQCKEDIARKDDEIKSLKEHYQGIIAKKDKELQKARDEAARLKQDNKELQKKLADELTRIRNEYEEKLKELENAKEVECLKLQLKHKDETHQLELQVKELECELSAKNAIVEEKKATIAELEKQQLEQKLKEQENESKRKLEEQRKELEWQLEEKQRLIASLQEKLQHSVTSNQQVEVPTSIASNETIKITPAGAEVLQPITDKPANLTLKSQIATKLGLGRENIEKRIGRN